MKLLKKIIYWILSLQFYLVTFLRNKFYDFGVFKSYSFETPVISVGNLSVGGTGKTPFVEFLIRHFSKNYKVAVLSRGYKRKSKGFILASDSDDSNSIGDEPFQYYSKFKDIKVAVDKKRKRGIKKLIKAGVNMIIYVRNWICNFLSPNERVIALAKKNIFQNYDFFSTVPLCLLTVVH